MTAQGRGIIDRRLTAAGPPAAFRWLQGRATWVHRSFGLQPASGGIRRWRGCATTAEDGSDYLDFGSGVGVNALGHAHPHLVKALSEQAARLWHTSNLYRIPEGERLAARLTEATFADAVFFTNSGVEALECAFKMARRYQYSRGEGQRFRLITFEGAFHGRTLAAIAAGGQAKYLEGFGPPVEGFDQVPLISPRSG